MPGGGRTGQPEQAGATGQSQADSPCYPHPPGGWASSPAPSRCELGFWEWSVGAQNPGVPCLGPCLALAQPRTSPMAAAPDPELSFSVALPRYPADTSTPSPSGSQRRPLPPAKEMTLYSNVPPPQAPGVREPPPPAPSSPPNTHRYEMNPTVVSLSKRTQRPTHPFCCPETPQEALALCRAGRGTQCPGFCGVGWGRSISHSALPTHRLPQPVSFCLPSFPHGGKTRAAELQLQLLLLP